MTLSSSIFFPLARFITLENSFWLAASYLNASKRLNCVFLFTINLHSLVNLHVSFLCFLQPRTSKNATPGDIAFEVIPKLTARVFIKFKSSCSSRWSFLSKTLHRLTVTSIFAQSKYSRPDLPCFKPFLPVQRYPFLQGLALNHHKKSPSPPLRRKISVNKIVWFSYQAPETFWF